MVDLKKLQKEIYDNKVAKGFNTTDINLEFCYLHEELAEAFRAYHIKADNLPDELADVAIFLLGISEILGVDLEKEIVRKVNHNKKRKVKKLNGFIVHATR
jgi:NTP pyrophosphatase (non-canonical NTP hydrolase)